MTNLNSGVSLQAIPEDSDLFRAARKDHEVAEAMTSCLEWAFRHKIIHPHWTARQKSIHALVQKLGKVRHDLRHRCFHADGETFEAIWYLLSVMPQDQSRDKETRLIYDVFHGGEALHPNAFAREGMSIGLVRAVLTHQIADFLRTVTYDRMHEHFDTEDSRKARIYKITRGEEQFDDIWDEFENLRKMYQAAAEHNEAVITEVHILVR